MGNMAVIAAEIDQLVVEIRDHIIVLVEHRAQVGMKLVQLRAAVESTGELWWPWLDANEHRFLVRGRQRGKIGRREIERLLKIGRASNPQAALEDEREKARDGMRKSRATNVSRDEAEPEPDDDDHQIVTVQGDLDDLDDGAESDAEAAAAEHPLDNDTRVRGLLYRAAESAEMARADLLDGVEITQKILSAVSGAERAWGELRQYLTNEWADREHKRRSTLPQDGRSEDGLVSVRVRTIAEPSTEPISVYIRSPDDDIGDIPPELDRRRH